MVFVDEHETGAWKRRSIQPYFNSRSSPSGSAARFPAIAMLDQADSTHEVVDSIAAPIVGVRNISKAFGPIVALKNVSLEVGAGEIRGICGENGAGKSTLVKILTGVYRPDDGDILVDGELGFISTPRQAQEQG